MLHNGPAVFTPGEMENAPALVSNRAAAIAARVALWIAAALSQRRASSGTTDARHGRTPRASRLDRAAGRVLGGRTPFSPRGSPSSPARPAPETLPPDAGACNQTRLG